MSLPIHFITVNFHCGDYIRGLIEAISASADDPGSLHVVVVNNSPSDRSLHQWIEGSSLPLSVHLIEAGANIGFGSGCNLGLKHVWQTDRQAVVEGLKSGVIDIIVSDHRPQDQDSKRVPFAQAEPGGIGLETLLPISLELVHNGHLTLPRLFQLLASTPARLFGLPGGKLAKGAPADLVVFDADSAWKVDRDELWSKTKNTPFDERPVQGRVMATIVGGRTIYRDDSFTAAVQAA